jgi:solute:Na+ symporter, SSS family
MAGGEIMAERTLTASQVASMLVSTSCGVGFLLGTGELALQQGMSACLYPIATALGLTVLALVARSLWTDGQSIWTRFDQRYGASVGSRVALLSLVWMTGVLAAQIRGGCALLALVGFTPTAALVLIDGTLIALSIMRLSWLSVGFAICMLASNATLVGSLVEAGGVDFWLHAPVHFVETLQQQAPPGTGLTLISIALMVVCGADYQQFLIVARTPAAARAGCILAAATVFTLGFLPACAVITASAVGHLDHLGDPVQAIPVLLIHTLSGNSASIPRIPVVIMLISTALGSGCAILRAMSDATATLGRPSVMRPIWSRILPVVSASLVASRGQSLVEMMVDLDIVYITAVGPLLALSLLKIHVSDKAANSAITAGSAIAMSCYLIQWSNIAALPEATALFLVLPLSLVVALASRRRVGASSNALTQSPALHQPDLSPGALSARGLPSHLSGDSGGN